MLKISGIQKTMDKIKSQVSNIERLAIQKEMTTLVTHLQEATPVDTGEAREGWKIVENQIVNDVPHIRFLNEGSSKQAPAHFIEQAVLNNPNLKIHGVIVRDK